MNNIAKKISYLTLLSTLLTNTKVSKVKADYVPNQNNLNVEVWGDPEYADSMIEVLDNLSCGLSNYMNARNLKIVLLDGTDASESVFEQLEGYYPGRILGVTFYEEDGSATIFVESGDCSNYYYDYPESSQGLTLEDFCYRMTRTTLLHELGHFLDIDYLSKTENFINIFYSECENFKFTTVYKVDNLQINANINTAEEYIASAFCGFVCYPEEMQLYCPRTYEFFYNLLDDIEYTYGNGKTLVLK